MAMKALKMDLEPDFDRWTHATLVIQRTWRGYCTRCKLFALLEVKASLMCASKASRMQSETLQDVSTLLSVYSPSKSRVSALSSFRSRGLILRIQRKYRDYLDGCIEYGLQPYVPAVKSFQSFCAGRIQTWWKECKRTSKTKVLYPNEAASVIQRCWRRHIDMQVYRYYRDLVSFRNRGDPSVMLRCINPTEAQLLDRGSGARVKFRLAGETFPPNIYYKIFIQSPIQDVCANAPRDYTNVCYQRTTARHTHNKGAPDVRLDKSSWYKRWENNGWRLVSDRFLHRALFDPVSFETSKKKIEFKHMKMQRKVDVERRRKQKKIEWMRKLYTGKVHLKTSTDTENEAHDDVDDLVEWTCRLDFDEYVSNWYSLATTSTSDNAGKRQLSSFSDDAFEVKVC